MKVLDVWNDTETMKPCKLGYKIPILTYSLPSLTCIHPYRACLHVSQAEFGFHLSWSLQFPIHPLLKDPPGKRGFFSTARRVQGWLSASSCALAGSHPERSSTGYCHSWQVGGWQKCAMKVAGKSGSGKKENPWSVWSQNHFTIFLLEAISCFSFTSQNSGTPFRFHSRDVHRRINVAAPSWRGRNPRGHVEHHPLRPWLQLFKTGP